MTDYMMIVREGFPSVNDLAKAAGVHVPASEDSPGALWLKEIATTFASEADAIVTAEFPGDQASERADGRISGGSPRDYWAAWTDLELWDYDNPNTGVLPWDQVGYLARDIMQDVAERLYQILLQTVLDAQADAEAGEAGEGS